MWPAARSARRPQAPPRPSSIPEWYEDPEEGWEEGAAPAILFRNHAAQVRSWKNAPNEIRRRQPNGGDEQRMREELSALRGALEQAITATRREILRHGLTPPPPPPELAHLDKEARP